MSIKRINESGKVTVKDALLDFWKGAIDYNGRSTRKGFWIGVIEYVVLLLLDTWIFGSLSYNYAGGVSGTILVTIGLIVFAIIIVMGTALSFRRLRDAGMKTLPITILLVLNALLFVAIFVENWFGFSINLIQVAYLILQFFLVILFCIPTDAMASDDETKAARNK